MHYLKETYNHKIIKVCKSCKNEKEPDTHLFCMNCRKRWKEQNGREKNEGTKTD